jgi:hypothetical protein
MLISAGSRIPGACVPVTASLVSQPQAPDAPTPRKPAVSVNRPPRLKQPPAGWALNRITIDHRGLTSAAG